VCCCCCPGAKNSLPTIKKPNLTSSRAVQSYFFLSRKQRREEGGEKRERKRERPSHSTKYDRYSPTVNVITRKHPSKKGLGIKIKINRKRDARQLMISEVNEMPNKRERKGKKKSFTDTQREVQIMWSVCVVRTWVALLHFLANAAQTHSDVSLLSKMVLEASK
jgi:hypothetical protein